MATDFLTTGNDIVSHIAGSRVECFEYDNMAASPPHAASGIFAAVAARGASGLYNLLAIGLRDSLIVSFYRVPDRLLPLLILMCGPIRSGRKRSANREKENLKESRIGAILM